MREYELGQLLVNDLLPEDMRDYNRVISKGSMGKLMTELAKKHPDQYKEVSHKLLQLGYQAAYLTNGDSFTLKDMSPTAISKKMQKELNKEVQDILAKARSKGIKTNDPKVNKAIIDACIKWSKKSDEGTTAESNFDTNALYRQAQKTGVGAQKPGTYKSIRTGDVLYVDQNNKPVPIPVTHSYAQGLRPAEYFAGAFGTRKGIVDLQKATQDAGYLCCAETELVMLYDFTSKAIKDIEVGDYVLGIEDNLDKPKYKPVRVTHVFNNGLRDCYKTVFDNDIEFVSTLDHKILCNAGKANNEILPVGSKGIKAITINNEALSIKEQLEVGKLNTYDLEVDSPNHLFVLASGLIVHNSKQLVQIAHRLVVDSNDSDQPYDEKNPIGYPSTVDDPDNEGAMLSMPVAGYKRNTVLTPKILADMKQKGVKNILVRSVIAGGPANGGIYAYDAGIRETGSLPAQGDFVGIKSVQAISEPITQSAISCLDPNTEVRMGDDTVKLLKDIKIGDIVLGANKKGEVAPTTVVNIFNNGVQEVWKTTYKQKDNQDKEVSINATFEHKILQIKDVNDTNADYVVSPLGIWIKTTPAAIVHLDNGETAKFARETSSFVGNIETLDIEVDNEDHLFVLANGMVVSNSKHSGGVAGAESGKAISGFKYINQLIQVPKHFPGGATHATVDGKVERIRPAAQGGYYITVAGHDHYVRTDKGDETPILVKVGDEVEAGDVMSDGIPNPAMIVKYKGLGEGRRYFTNMFRDALDRAGTPVNRRNIETLSRGLISYVKLNSEIGDYSPDDILPYAMVAADYQPRDGYVAKEPKSCKGMYLEKPVLHYTIGTRITPKVIKELNDFGIKQVTCHKDPPPFESEMVRGMAHAASDPDWGTKMLGSYNKESLLESARLGAVSNTQGTSYVPALAFGDPNFGNTGATKQGAYELLKAAARLFGI